MFQRFGLSTAALAVALGFVSAQSARAGAAAEPSPTEARCIKLVESCAASYENYSMRLCGWAARIVGIYNRYYPPLAVRLANIYTGINDRVAAQKTAYIDRIVALCERLDPEPTGALQLAAADAKARIEAARLACNAEIEAAAGIEAEVN